LKAYLKAYSRAHQQTPKRKAYLKAFEQTPKRRAYRREYNQTLPRKARHANVRSEMLALYDNACLRCRCADLSMLEQHHTKGGYCAGYPDYPPELRCNGTFLAPATIKWVADHDGSLPPDIDLLCRKCHRIADKELAARLATNPV
jgi:hypothetical protein